MLNKTVFFYANNPMEMKILLTDQKRGNNANLELKNYDNMTVLEDFYELYHQEILNLKKWKNMLDERKKVIENYHDMINLLIEFGSEITSKVEQFRKKIDSVMS